jgi:putative ABC transport system permease protein
LRAIGASTGDVSRMFTAETVLIGLAASILGVVVTYLACIPINAVVKSLTGLNQ